MAETNTPPTKPKHPKRHGEILIDDVVVKDLESVRNISVAGAAAARPPTGGQISRLGGQNIVTVEIPKEQTIEQFEPGRLHGAKGLRYSDVVKGMTPDTTARSSRFRLSELARGPLSVEAEEEARIESEVQSRLAARLEEMREAVVTQGYEEGFAAGKQTGHKETISQARPALEAFEGMLAQFESMKLEIFKANEELFLHLVNQLARSVILRELKDDKDYVKRLAVQLLERLGTRENIKLFVREAELSSAEEIKAGLAQMLGQLKNITIEADASIGQGGCRVETEFGEVDARIETQIENIAQGLGLKN